MYAVSQDFLNALAYPHKIAALVQVIPSSGSGFTLDVESGSVTCAYQQGTRRTASLTVHATGTNPSGSQVTAATVMSVLQREDTAIRIQAGLSSNHVDQVMIPMITGIITNLDFNHGQNTIQIQISDDWWRVSQGRFTSPWTPDAATTRVAAVTQLMQTVAPNRQVIAAASDTGQVGDGNWGDARDNAINTLATDGGFDVYFDRQGRIIIADTVNTASKTPVWTLSGSQGGVLETVDDGLIASTLYNAVTVKPSNNQTWTAQTVTLTSGPRSPAALGVIIPYIISSATITTAADALAVATNRLHYVTGLAKTIQCTAINNPALDEGDTITVNIPAIGLNPAVSENWYLDQLSLDLQTGDMTIRGRNQADITES